MRKGYTTGAHTLHAFNNTLSTYLLTRTDTKTYTKKMDNDDLDVTKGCEIVVHICEAKSELVLNQTEHNPQQFIYGTNSIEIYAGLGVGVVTKKGLKISPSYPAVNPVPLSELEKAFKEQVKSYNDLHLYCSISVTDGELIAKQTANAKVGVIGGISILGTTGYVKPVSNSAYIDSVKTEIGFAVSNEYSPVVLTLGNSSLKQAKEIYEDGQIIEIGNFVYDALLIAKDKGAKKIVFVCGLGKLTKVAQGFKDTHNRFGSIDFDEVQKWVDISLEGVLTMKRVGELLGDKKEEFDRLLKLKAQAKMKEWVGMEVGVILC